MHEILFCNICQLTRALFPTPPDPNTTSLYSLIVIPRCQGFFSKRHTNTQSCRKRRKGNLWATKLLFIIQILMLNMLSFHFWEFSIGVNSVPQSKNMVCTFQTQAYYFLLPLEIHEEISRQSMFFNDWRASEGSIIYHIKHTTFHHGNGLTWNWIFNGSIYYVWYLQILCFYFVRQIARQWNKNRNQYRNSTQNGV